MLGINEKIWSITQAETRTENDTEIYEFIYTKKTKAINVFDKYGTEDAVLRTGNNVFAVDTTPEFNPETKVDWVLDKVTVNNSEAKLEDGKIKATGYDNKDIVFIYKKNETAKPEDEPKKKPEKKPEEKPETRPEPQGPSDITVPVVPTTPEPPTIETPVVNITDDTTPQGTAPTTPSAPSDENKDETETLDLEKDETPQGEIEIEEDETPQGETDIEDDDIPQGEAYIEDEATPQGIAKTAEEVQIEEDVTPKGDKTLPRTGGTSADVLNIVGLGLIGLGLVVKKRK